jgi:hypothetical protein
MSRWPISNNFFQSPYFLAFFHFKIIIHAQRIPVQGLTVVFTSIAATAQQGAASFSLLEAQMH